MLLMINVVTEHVNGMLVLFKNCLWVPATLSWHHSHRHVLSSIALCILSIVYVPPVLVPDSGDWLGLTERKTAAAMYHDRAQKSFPFTLLSRSEMSFSGWTWQEDVKTGNLIIPGWFVFSALWGETGHCSLTQTTCVLLWHILASKYFNWCSC